MATQINLPRDAEGREIPLNTTALYDDNGRRREVDWYTFYPDKDIWDVVLEDSSAHFSPHNLSLDLPDSLEKLLDGSRITVCDGQSGEMAQVNADDTCDDCEPVVTEHTREED